MDFSASTYLDGMGIVSKSGATTVADLEKMDKVGTIDGYLWVEDLKKILGDKLVTYPSSVELKADFDAGRLDADVDAYGVQVLQFKGADGVSVALSNEKPGPTGRRHRPRPRGRVPDHQGQYRASRKRSTPGSSPSARWHHHQVADGRRTLRRTREGCRKAVRSSRKLALPAPSS